MYIPAMRLNRIRKQRGISQVDLAEMIGVSQATISKMESMEEGCTIGKYAEYAAALGVTLSDLFADERSAAENALLTAFRQMPPDRQAGWIDMAKLAKSDQP